LKRIPSYKYLFGVSDFIIITFSFLFSIYALRYNISTGFIDFYSEAYYIIPLIILIALLMLLIFVYNGLYRIDVILKRSQHIPQLAKAVYYSSLQIVLFSLLIDISGYMDSRLLIFVFLITVVSLLILFRVIGLRYFFLSLSNSGFRRDVAIIGEGKQGKILAAKLMYENPFGLNLVGFIGDNHNTGDFVVAGKKILGGFDEIEEVVKKYNIDELIVAVDDKAHDKLLDILDTCKKLNVSTRVTSELFDVVPRRISTEKYYDIPVINVAPQYNDGITLSLKRITDVIFASLGLLVLSPFMIFIALSIKLSSPGAVLFKQERVGKYGRKFNFYKFRSMEVIDGEDEERKKKMIDFMKNQNADGSDTKIVNDNRITWIGKIIRRTSLDELPQLFNVIKGDMSLVGPRPCLPYEFDNYDSWQKRRVSVIPGCTGVWQVWGRSVVSFEESVVLDLYYINNMSPWLDLQLLMQTIPVMLFSRGAR
jgi:undecaprenyl-phosphate galactose phosphotransferase